MAESTGIVTKGLYHLGMPVNDMDRAVDFYTNVLGMTIDSVGKDDMAKGTGRVALYSGEDMVVLFERPTPREKDWVEEEGATHQAFSVDGETFDRALETRHEWGVELYGEVMTRPSGRSFYFYDTEGNLLQLQVPPQG